VILIDDAHETRPDVLAILRALSNFEMDSRLVVSLVLVGQSPLRALLRRADLEDVARRISFYGALRLLSRDESRDYLDHRLRLAGATSDLFDAGAYEALYEATQGNLRALDTLALRALYLAAQAGVTIIDARIVIAARAQVSP
jgi:general secretion pathway protein A